MYRSPHPRLAAALMLPLLVASAQASTTWDGGAPGDTSISNALNWSDDVLPDLSGPALLTFGTAAGTATIDVPVEVTRAILSNSFTLAAGSGTLTVRGTSSGANSYGIQATSNAALAVVDEPVLVKAVTTSGALGNLLLLYNNRVAAGTTTFRINAGISLAPTSTATGYNLRYGSNSATPASAANTRIAGAITGLTTLQNSSSGGAWAGGLIIAGDQASLTSSDISMGTTGFLTPTSSARLILGETKDDDQTWRNVGLTNTINLAIGGNISISALTTSSAIATKITGIAADLVSAGTLRIASGTVNTLCTIGGAGTNENNLNIAKSGTGTLTINGTHTYLGSTTVDAGVLVLNGTVASPLVVKASAVATVATGATAGGGVTVESGGTLGGEGAVSGALTFGTGFGYLNFDPATAGALTAASVSATGSTIIVTPTSAGTVGTPCLVLTSAGGLSGVSFSAGSPGLLALQNGATELWFTPSTAVAQTLTWTGSNATNPTVWNVAAVPNWLNGATQSSFFGGDNVVFDDTAVGTTVSVQGTVSVGSATFSNATKNYALSGGGIAGSGLIVKDGAAITTIDNALSNTGGVTVNGGHLVLNGTNTFTGGLDIASGTVSFTVFANLGSTATAVDFTGGGALRFAGAATVTNDTFGFNLGLGGGTFFTDTAANVTVRLGGKLSGAGAISKTGAGVLALGRTGDIDPGNDFTGPLTVSAGTLDIRSANSLGATSDGTTVQNATLLIQNFGQTAGTHTFAAEPLTFSGASFVTSYGQEAKFYANQLPGPVSVSAGTVLGLSSARSLASVQSATLELNGPSVTTGAGSTLAFGLRPALYPAGFNEDAQTVTISAPITGPAAVTTQGAALSVYTLSAPSYSGDTTVNAATLRLLAANPSNDTSIVSIAATGATLELAFAGDDTVGKLYVGGVQLDAGIYKAVGNVAATGTELPQLAGTGTLTVASGPIVLTAYEVWAGSYALSGNDALAASDPDGDGLSNLFEYATGGSPILGGQPNVTVNFDSDLLRLTYTRIADGSLTYTVEGTNDLTGIWTAVPVAGNPSTGVANTAGQVTVVDTVTVSTAGKRYLRLRVTN